ncbi:MAG: hypothetical protein CL920_20455 [Deltaproteobacteria bacterium]|nr:hypothetical protein [Deltaproteobacteria bacterium]MBU51065.1 hypothetical protein [Deltaproteobacteria bacterium]
MTDQPSPSSSSPPLSETIPGGTRRFILPGIFVLVLFGVLFYRMPRKQATTHSVWHVQGRIFGTTYNIKVIHKTKLPKGLHMRLKAALQRVDEQMSTYNKKSELSRFNAFKQTTPFKVSAALVQVVSKAHEITKMTGGAFDVTIGPVINAWGFGPKKRIKPPAQDVLDKAKQRVGAAKLTYDNNTHTLRKTRADLYVDLSAIAKGYGVDVVGRELERAGFRDYMVEIGGEVRARGKNPRGIAWRIGIEKPGQGQQQIHTVVPLHNMSMATSGNYRNYITVQGKRISHIIDARTANPITHDLASVSVFHKDCTTADALATALFVLGAKEGLALAETHKLAVAFLVPKGKGFVMRASKTFQALTSPQHKKPATRKP